MPQDPYKGVLGFPRPPFMIYKGLNSGQICVFTHKTTILEAFLDLKRYNIKVPTNMLVIMCLRTNLKSFLNKSKSVILQVKT